MTPSPYNTLLHKGLPPTPISSPGLVSLKAAMHPPKTNYLYWVEVNPDGKMAFASTDAGFRRLQHECRSSQAVLSGDGQRGHGARPGGRLGSWPSAHTVVVGVIGDPVDHSLSPALHNAALAELGLDWAYVAFPVPAGRGQAAVAAMADLGIRGLSVTMPHKQGAALACHQLSPVAERLGVANTVTNLSGDLVGDSTDGPGFIDSLADQGWHPEGKRCLVLGAGGAARAVVLALAEAGHRASRWWPGARTTRRRRRRWPERPAPLPGWRPPMPATWWSTPRLWG